MSNHQNPLFSFYKDTVIDNTSIEETDSDGNPTKIKLFSCGKHVATIYINYSDGNISNVRTEYVSPPLEWWYA